MGPRHAKLKEEWLLRGWTDVPWALVNWRSGDYYQLSRDGFYVAQACDGRTDFGSPAFLPRHTVLLDKLIARGIAEECRAGEPFPPVSGYRAAENPLVRGIQWAITGRCNLRCRHCYMEAPYGQQGQLSFPDLALLADRLAGANIAAVALTGGEPFMRNDLPAFIRLLNAKKIRLADIYTNGTLVGDAVLQELRAAAVRPVFRISFDGCGAHDLMRGTPGVEAVVVDAIRRIRAAGFAVVVSTCLDRTNLATLLPTYELMKELGLLAWGVARPQPVGCGRDMTTGLSLEEMAGPCEELLRRWRADGRPFTIGLEAFYSGAGADGGGGTAPAAPKPPSSIYACASCRQWLYLAPDGKLLPCISYGDTAYLSDLPNLLAMSFSEAWNHPSLHYLLDLKKSDIIARNQECACCDQLDACGTGCRTAALLSGGGLLAKDPVACELWKGGYKKRFAALASEGG